MSFSSRLTVRAHAGCPCRISSRLTARELLRVHLTPLIGSPPVSSRISVSRAATTSASFFFHRPSAGSLTANPIDRPTSFPQFLRPLRNRLTIQPRELGDSRYPSPSHLHRFPACDPSPGLLVGPHHQAVERTMQPGGLRSGMFPASLAPTDVPLSLHCPISFSLPTYFPASSRTSLRPYPPYFAAPPYFVEVILAQALMAFGRVETRRERWRNFGKPHRKGTNGRWRSTSRDTSIRSHTRS